MQVIYITLRRAEYYVDRLVGATFCMTVNLGYIYSLKTYQSGTFL